MGEEFTTPCGVSKFLPEHLLVDMFFQGVNPTVKDVILSNFTCTFACSYINYCFWYGCALSRY